MSGELYNKASRTRVLSSLPSKSLGKDGDIVLSTIQGKGSYLCVKSRGEWYATSKLEELRKLEKTSIRDLSVNKLRLGDATLTKQEYNTNKDFTLDSNGDIELNAGGGDIAFKDDSADLAALSSSGLTINNISEVGSDTDKFLTSDSGTVKYVTGANLLSYIGGQASLTFGISDTNITKCGAGIVDDDFIRVNGTTFEGRSASEVRSDIGAGTSSVGALNDLSDVTYSSGDLTISSLDTIISGDLTFDSSGDITLDVAGEEIHLKTDGDTFIKLDATASKSRMWMFEAGGASTDDYFLIDVRANAETTIQTKDTAASAGHLNIEPDGHVEFDGCGVGFDLVTPTYNGTNTNVYFKDGNKQFVTFGSGNITNLNLSFPATSGNFVLMLKQDGTGSRLITNYLAYDSGGAAANGSSTVKFAGGSNPTLTTDANHVDIISIFWDADNEIAYGVATLDFQF